MSLTESESRYIAGYTFAEGKSKKGSVYAIRRPVPPVGDGQPCAFFLAPPVGTPHEVVRSRIASAVRADFMALKERGVV